MLALLEDVGAKTWLIVIGCLGVAISVLAFHHAAYKQGVQTCATAASKQVITAQTAIQNTNTTLETETLDVQKAKGYMLPVSPVTGAAYYRLYYGRAPRK